MTCAHYSTDVLNCKGWKIKNFARMANHTPMTSEYTQPLIAREAYSLVNPLLVKERGLDRAHKERAGGRAIFLISRLLNWRGLWVTME